MQIRTFLIFQLYCSVEFLEGTQKLHSSWFGVNSVSCNTGYCLVECLRRPENSVVGRAQVMGLQLFSSSIKKLALFPDQSVAYHH